MLRQIYSAVVRGFPLWRGGDEKKFVVPPGSLRPEAERHDHFQQFREESCFGFPKIPRTYRDKSGILVCVEEKSSDGTLAN
jgi:hypothetical protein